MNKKITFLQSFFFGLALLLPVTVFGAGIEILTSTGTTNSKNYGNNSIYCLRQGFKIPASQNVNSVVLSLKKTGSPTNNSTLKIVDASDVQYGSTATLANSGLTTSYTWQNFSFDTPAPLVSGTQYYLVLTTSTQDGTNYPILQSHYTNTYANGSIAYDNVSTSCSGADFTNQDESFDGSVAYSTAGGTTYATTTATTTVPYSPEFEGTIGMFLAFMVFYMSMWFIVWFFKKKR